MSSLTPFADARAKLLAAGLGVPIMFPNEIATTPEPPAPWLAVSTTSSVLQPVDLGAGVWQEEGTLYIDVHVPFGSGSDTARSLAKAVAGAFRGLGPEDVVYLSAGISDGQTAEDGVWWTMTVSIDWRYDDH